MYAEDSGYVVHEKVSLSQDALWWLKLGQELFAKRKLKVVCIGAGLSGILFAIRLPMMTENVELVVYEKNPKVWFELASLHLH